MKENTAHVIVACQNNVLLLWCTIRREIEYWFLCLAHTNVSASKYYIQILYNTMTFYKWKLNMKLLMNYLQKDN